MRRDQRDLSKATLCTIDGPKGGWWLPKIKPRPAERPSVRKDTSSKQAWTKKAALQRL